MLGTPISLSLAGNPGGMSKARVTNHQNTTTFIAKNVRLHTNFDKGFLSSGSYD
jgi:hypothetical protein